MMLNYYKRRAGFTLIEMIVSLGVFALVVTTAVGALLALISTNQQLQAEQSVMTNLSFALDTMTREMRVGYNYYCHSESSLTSSGSNNIFANGSNHEDLVDTDTQDCPNGRPSGDDIQGISFYEGGHSLTGTGGDRRILYFYDADEKTIMRRVGNGQAQSIVSSGLVVQNAEFTVTGSDVQNGNDDFEQPTVTVYIEAQDKDDVDAKTYYLETTITQRSLDL